MAEPPPKPTPPPPSAGVSLHHHHHHHHHHCHHYLRHHHHCHNIHHHLHAPSCPLARPILPCPLLRFHHPFPTYLPNTCAAAPDLPPPGVTVPVVDSRLEIAGHDTSKNSEAMREHLDEIVEDEEDAEPIFVLTEEWVEFFAKSEAKRRLEKKKKHKKGGG